MSNGYVKVDEQRDEIDPAKNRLVVGLEK